MEPFGVSNVLVRSSKPNNVTLWLIARLSDVTLVVGLVAGVNRSVIIGIDVESEIERLDESIVKLEQQQASDTLKLQQLNN